MFLRFSRLGDQPFKQRESLVDRPLMPPGWSVHVDGTWVVVRGLWASHSELYMTASGARALANELGIAYLAATGAFGLLGDRDAVRSALKDALRRRPGYIEQLEYDAAHPETATEFDDWKNPDTADPARPDGELAALGETLQSAWSRWAFDLWGLKRGQADVENGCEATRQWFEGAANEVNQ